MGSIETTTDPVLYWTNCSYGWHMLADGAELGGDTAAFIFFDELAQGADLMLYVLGA